MHWIEIQVELPAGVSSETVYAVIYSHGSTGCSEEGDVMRAYFGSESDVDTVVRELESLGVGISSINRVEDTDWSAGWKETIGPYRAAGFLICPPWKSDGCLPEEGETKIVIDPGEAFGEGGHPTTASVLGLMRKWSERRGDLSGLAMLDVGTGTGILSVAAAALGFGGLSAVDIETKAVRTAKANFVHSGIEKRIELSLGGIETASGSYDLIVANVFLEPLIAIIPAAARLLRSGGALIISGVLTDQFGEIEGRAVGAGFTLSESVESDGWVSGLFLINAGREERP